MELTIGFSPCPNDTFIFDAMVNGKMDTNGLTFKVYMEDVQTLNEWALEGKLDISKISYGVLPKLIPDYALLNSGSALGNGVGPLLIHADNHVIDFDKEVVAVPGENTTAHRLFSSAFPEAKNKIFLRYDQIENYVIQKKGPGVIIHENRFTYQQKGLYKLADLGELWETKYGFPIPLGGIVIRKKIAKDIQTTVDHLIKNSLQQSFNNYPVISTFVSSNAQEMEEHVMRQHIDLYVNDYSLDLGDHGKNAIKHFLSVSEDPLPQMVEFV